MQHFLRGARAKLIPDEPSGPATSDTPKAGRMSNTSIPGTEARRVPRAGEMENVEEADAFWAPLGASLTASFHGGNGLGPSPAGVTGQPQASSRDALEPYGSSCLSSHLRPGTLTGTSTPPVVPEEGPPVTQTVPHKRCHLLPRAGRKQSRQKRAVV